MGEIHGVTSSSIGNSYSVLGLDPAAVGWLSWNTAPWSAGSVGTAITPGTIYGMKAPWPFASQALSTIGFNIATVGATLSGSQVAVFDMAGNRLAAAVSADAAFLAGSYQTLAMSIPAGTMPANSYVYVAFLAVGTTGPALIRTANATSAQMNVSATGSNLPFAQLGGLTAQGSIPPSVALGSNNPTSIATPVFLK